MEESLGESEGDMNPALNLGVDMEQNLVEADQEEPVVGEILEITNPPLLMSETIENLNYAVLNVNRHNFGIVDRKINATVNQ